MAIVVGETWKETFKIYAGELHGIANPTCPSSEKKVAVEAFAKILDKFAEMQIPFCDLDRFCYFLIKDAAKEIEGIYYTPDEVLKVVDEERKKDEADGH